jgi:hypothetical protein
MLCVFCKTDAGFLHLRIGKGSFTSSPQWRHICGRNRQATPKPYRDFMDEHVQKSCWSVTLWTVAAVGLALAMILLFNDVENAQQTVAIAK